MIVKLILTQFDKRISLIKSEPLSKITEEAGIHIKIMALEEVLNNF